MYINLSNYLNAQIYFTISQYFYDLYTKH